MHTLLDTHPEVAAALQQGRPVVALESTIISHGMPWPQNLETALRVEAAVREHGAVPATVAVIGGRLKAGLARDEIEALARQGLAVAKASRRDLPFLMAAGVGPAMGATTVAATMIVAALAGIRVFATGGIGGVHRGAETSFDISADLQELARTSVAVVCAGAKAMLDLKLTLEYLETHGVPVIGFGSDELPAFYSRASGLKVNRRLDTPEAIARVLHAKWQAGLQGGVVVAQPIAAEHEIPHQRIATYIQQALQEAQAQGVAGAGVTPFLLARVSELSGGASLAANIELVLANARLAARVAAALAALGGAVKALTSAGLPERLRTETRALQAAGERSGAMAALLGGRLPRTGYTALLRNLHAVYATLEAALHARRGDAAIAALHVEPLLRAAALAADLATLHGPAWADELPLQPATTDYTARLQALAQATTGAPALVAHAYVRYLGDLHGGQVLQGLVRRQYGLAGEAGTSFYDFGPTPQLLLHRQHLRQALSALPLTAAEQDVVVAEALWAFEQHRRLFEELAATTAD